MKLYPITSDTNNIIRSLVSSNTRFKMLIPFCYHSVLLIAYTIMWYLVYQTELVKSLIMHRFISSTCFGIGITFCLSITVVLLKLVVLTLYRPYYKENEFIMRNDYVDECKKLISLHKWQIIVPSVLTMAIAIFSAICTKYGFLLYSFNGIFARMDNCVVRMIDAMFAIWISLLISVMIASFSLASSCYDEQKFETQKLSWLQEHIGTFVRLKNGRIVFRKLNDTDKFVQRLDRDSAEGTVYSYNWLVPFLFFTAILSFVTYFAFCMKFYNGIFDSAVSTTYSFMLKCCLATLCLIVIKKVSAHFGYYPE